MSGAAAMQLHGLFWWSDRWLKSSAYLTLTLEEQGAYRNLLDHAHLRGGALPTDERILAKASGDAQRWKAIRARVMHYFVKREDGWHNETLDAVLAQSARRATKQQSYRARRGKKAGNANGNANGDSPGNDGGNKPGSPDPDPDLERSGYLPDPDLER
jgi:uncharacterized protein YdaU (DUF1376 family)